MKLLLLLPVLALLALLVVCGNAIALPLQLIDKLARAIARVWRRLRRRAQRPTAYPPLDDAALRSDALLFIVLHGTYARHAGWTSPGSLLHKALLGAMAAVGQPCMWHRLGWSGDNTVVDRLLATDELSALLQRVFAQQPARRVVLLGHSHGGSIAFKAAEAFGHAPHLRVVTLATPFIWAQPRLGAGALALLLPALHALVLALAVGVAVFVWLDLGDWTFVWAELAAFTTLVLAGTRLRHLYAEVQADEQALLRSVPKPALLAAMMPRTFIVSRAGDEADGGLKLVSVANGWITRTMNSAGIFDLSQQLVCIAQQSPVLRAAMAAPVASDAPPAGLNAQDLRLRADALAAWSEIAPATAPAPDAAEPGSVEPGSLRLAGRAALVLWNANKTLLALELLSMWCGLLVLSLLQKGVGTRTATVAARVTLSSSETPPGRWQHLQTLPSRRSDGELLSHSQIYSDPEVLAAVAAWVVNDGVTPSSG